MAGEGALRGLARRAAPSSPRRRAYASLFRNPSALLGGAVLLALLAVAILAPRLAPLSQPDAQSVTFAVQRSVEPHSPPFWDRSGDVPPDEVSIFEEQRLPYDPRYVLGTDWERRDMLSLLLYGTRVSVSVGLLAVALVALVGAALGLAAGWFGGARGEAITRVADLADAVPALLAYMLIALVASQPLARALASIGLHLDAVPVMAIVLASIGWVPVARLVRGQVRSLKHEDWVLAARATGVPDRRIALRHVLPHTVGPVLVAASAQLPAMLLADGLLGRIGVGARPSSDSLGELIFREFRFTISEPEFVLMPTALVIALSLALSALADGVERALQPGEGG